MQYINGYLADYEKDKLNRWRSKDAALYLIMSLSAQSSTVQVCWLVLFLGMGARSVLI